MRRTAIMHGRRRLNPAPAKEKVDKLTVFGGLDGVLNDTVRINVRPD